LHHPRTGDNVRLREHIYLLIKRAFNVYLRISSIVKDGLYHITYTYSDEYCNAKEISLNITLAGCFFKTVNCSNRLKMDDPLLPKWEEVFSKIQDYHTDENGIMIGKDVSLAKLYRHYCYFFIIFLLYDITFENSPERIPMIKKTFNILLT
jgi:alpha-L-fucosidase 2